MLFRSIGVVAVFCAVAGVEPQSETVWRQATKYNVPRIAFINKMDRTGADFYNAIDTMKKRLGTKPLPIALPIGAGETFRGIIDLTNMKAIEYNESSQGAEFEYIDMLGGIRNFAYRLSDAFEGQMVFFPASLRHTVYPFFNIPGKPEKDNGTRISIAGNLWYDTTGMGSEGNYSTILKESAMKNESESYDYSNDEFKNKIDIKRKVEKLNVKDSQISNKYY